MTIQAITDAIRAKTHRTSEISENNLALEVSCIPSNYRYINTLFGKDYTNFDNAWQAIKTAITYWNAKKSGTITFNYSDGNGCLKGDTSADLHDENGNAIIDCSTFVGLVLRGISSLDSLYYTSSAQSCNPRNIVCVNNSWTEKYLDKQSTRYATAPIFPTYTHKTATGEYRVLTAADICQYYDKMGLTWFADDGEARTGDLCFFYKENEDGTLKYPNRFLGISHIGIMLDSEYYLNATNVASTGYLVRTAVATRQPYMYARPTYGALENGVTNQLTVEEIDLVPDVWSGLTQGTTIQDGRRLTLDGKVLSVTTVGTPSNALVLDVISSGCPLTLPAGTYMVYGVNNNTGTNHTTLHRYWGIRVYDEDGNGIPGVTYSCDGNSHETRTPVWDIGEYGMFTLTSETRITINVYLSANKTFTDFIINPMIYKM